MRLNILSRLNISSTFQPELSQLIHRSVSGGSAVEQQWLSSGSAVDPRWNLK
ncbi:hypothetical protein MHH60_30085 [Paenibacillus sp. FSL H7-0716]|uniref:hypothetical protein n=1 Tax=Paenibacillus odorifer TaxID=189426 RepID=UPI0015C408BD|nr:hypothetical protein [Paenibacillus odorifer]